MSVTDSSKNQAKTGNYNPVELEKEVADRWKSDKTFENSIEIDAHRNHLLFLRVLQPLTVSQEFTTFFPDCSKTWFVGGKLWKVIW